MQAKRQQLDIKFEKEQKEEMRKLSDEIRGRQSFYKQIAVFIPPIFPLIIGLVVFFSRRAGRTGRRRSAAACDKSQPLRSLRTFQKYIAIQLYGLTMNENSKTFAFVAAAVVLLGLGIWKSIPTPDPDVAGVTLGKEFFPEFTDPLKVASASIVDLDADSDVKHDLKVERVDGQWQINPGKQGYEQVSTDRLADVVKSVIGVKILAVASDNPESIANLPSLIRRTKPNSRPAPKAWASGHAEG